MCVYVFSFSTGEIIIWKPAPETQEEFSFNCKLFHKVESNQMELLQEDNCHE